MLSSPHFAETSLPSLPQSSVWPLCQRWLLRARELSLLWICARRLWLVLTFLTSACSLLLDTRLLTTLARVLLPSCSFVCGFQSQRLSQPPVSPKGCLDIHLFSDSIRPNSLFFSSILCPYFAHVEEEKRKSALFLKTTHLPPLFFLLSGLSSTHPLLLFPLTGALTLTALPIVLLLSPPRESS